MLDAGCSLSEDHHEIDVANVLKTFLRELPDPLIPHSFHDLFLRCTLLSERKTEAIMLACLLLPTEHLNTLTYIMQVSTHLYIKLIQVLSTIKITLTISLFTHLK